MTVNEHERLCPTVGAAVGFVHGIQITAVKHSGLPVATSAFEHTIREKRLALHDDVVESCAHALPPLHQAWIVEQIGVPNEPVIGATDSRVGAYIGAVVSPGVNEHIEIVVKGRRVNQ